MPDLNRRDFLRTGAALTAGLVSSSASSAPAPAPAVAAPGAPLSPTALELRRDYLTIDDLEAKARELLPRSYYEYFASGVADEITLRWNRESYQRLRLRPRVLNDVSGLDCSLELFGQRLETPILLAPASNHMLAHPEGELATARGAGITKTTMILSSAANKDIKEVVGAATSPVWFQLYAQHERALTSDMVQHAMQSGSQALCVTIDSPVDGMRNRQTRARLKRPEGVGFPNYFGRNTTRPSLQTLDEVRPQKLDWAEIDWLRTLTKKPLLLKGILHPVDAVRALEHGVDGIVVSNHGGRALDTAPATIDALPDIVDAVAGRMPILIDGGIRRGTDVLKAIATGATAVLIGRPYIYGLAVGGAEGVAHALQILRMELLSAMALCGAASLAKLDRSILWPANGPLSTRVPSGSP